ncbi:type I iodothyronine deiodinase [Paramuricea clavata]|uniref:Iodothyronine deiodinase n=1 Tax=Paramuricea clavata TaxID=317549 RepID=A0A6S7H4U3_PARCT|nr:type I iodothyronine deiodinase [Paramuricea clavata]
MAKLAKFNEIVRDFNDVADFAIIYISEAHAKDGWAFKNNYEIRQHQSLHERLDAAKHVLARNPPCPVYVDTMANTMKTAYAALPERLYVIDEDKIAYVGEMGPEGYNLDELRRWLAEYRNNARRRTWTR